MLREVRGGAPASCAPCAGGFPGIPTCSPSGAPRSLQEFCEWIESKEKLSHTAAGADLGVNEPIDKPHNQGAGRKWFTTPLEMSARSQSRR